MKLLCILLTMLLLAGCGGQATAPTPTPTPVETPSPTPAATPEPTPAPMALEDIPFERLVFAVRTSGWENMASLGKQKVEADLLEKLRDPAYAERVFYLNCRLEYGTANAAERLKERGFYVEPASDGSIQLAVVGTAEMVLGLENCTDAWKVRLGCPPRPAYYPDTVEDMLAYLLEHDVRETYRVGVFLRGANVGYAIETGFYQWRYYTEKCSRDFYENNTIPMRSEKYWEAYYADYGLADIEKMTESQALAVLQKQMDGVLERYGITPSELDVRMNFSDEKGYIHLQFTSYCFFEADLTALQLRMLMLDDDVRFIDWNEEEMQ